MRWNMEAPPFSRVQVVVDASHYPSRPDFSCQGDVFDSIRQGHEDGLDVAANRAGASAETIGQRLRRLRTERRFSQRELSSPGVSYAYISRIEAGTRQPS